MKTNLPKKVVIERYKLQLRDWEIAKLDTSIAHETHVEIGSKQDVIDNLATRLIEVNKAIRLLTTKIEALEKPAPTTDISADPASS